MVDVKQPAMIELEGVSKRFGDFYAVRDLDLRVPAGELFCFLGPNGAGKTTTIKMLCGLLKPSAGRLRVGGYDLHEQGQEVRRITGYIPDFPFLYDRLTVTEFYQFCGELHDVPRDEVGAKMEKAFEILGLHDYRDVLIRDLSHGLRQRVIYAVTLLHDPKVIFVDEPFIGLDPFSIRLIKTLLRERVRAGGTVFLTTHILALIEDLADRVGIIVNGRLVSVGSLEELRRQKGQPGARLEDIFFSLVE
jgi:ABC-2 type transport system ATP-binding protein